MEYRQQPSDALQAIVRVEDRDAAEQAEVECEWERKRDPPAARSLDRGPAVGKHEIRHRSREAPERNQLREVIAHEGGDSRKHQRADERVKARGTRLVASHHPMPCKRSD